MIAITINNKELVKELKSIDFVYNFLSSMGDVYIIAVERNDLNKNTHYHALIDGDITFIEKFNNIWSKVIETDIEVLKYIDYIKKDGTFKVYKKLDIESNNDHWTSVILNLVLKYDSLNQLFHENPRMIKYITYIERLYKIYKI